jgi:methylmalonyl-CoA/ethylmalonyl-CoA epimerase
MTQSNSPKQLRLIIETDDFDEALRFYRDTLGMPEQPAFATEGDDRVSILHAGIATIELATSTHIRNIDSIERAPTPEGPTLRIALEVQDTEKAVGVATAAGAEPTSPVVRTPFETLNARVLGPGGWQVTFFQELESLKDRSARDGFSTDDKRAR